MVYGFQAGNRLKFSAKHCVTRSLWLKGGLTRESTVIVNQRVYLCMYDDLKNFASDRLSVTNLQHHSYRYYC